MRAIPGDAVLTRLATAPDHAVELPFVSDTRILLGLASLLSLPNLIAAIDSARRVAVDGRSGGDCDVDAVLTALREHPGLWGVRRLREALASSRPGVGSRSETLLRLILAGAGFPEPVVGFSIRGAGWSATPDLAWPEWNVLVEYEGDHHRTDDRQFAHDVRRFDRYHDVGWSTIRATRTDVYSSTRELIARVDRRLRARGWRGPVRCRELAIPAFLP